MSRAAGKALGVLALACVVTLGAIPPLGATEPPPPMVARVTHVDGELLRFVPADEDWVATVADSPLGPKDVLYSDKDGKAEFSFPNRTLARVGPATQVEVTGIDPDLTDLYVASGQLRLQNHSSDATLRASTPFGYVIAPPRTAADLYVGDESLEVISLERTVQFIHTQNGFDTKYDVVANQASLVADSEAASPGDGTVDADWDGWNVERDRLLSQRARVRSAYLPEPLQDDAHVFAEHGRWERVYYDGGYRHLWRPRVVVGWSPFTRGRWTTWSDEQVWVPAEPFGYVTHHHGNWVVVGGAWYWMPPPVVIVGHRHHHVHWYPGRVAWIHSDAHIGWVPLAPHEVFFGFRLWGPGVTVVTHSQMPAVHHHHHRLRFVDHAVVVGHHHMYSTRDYHSVRVANINRTTIINNYNAAPVVHKTVIKNVNVTNQYNYVDRRVTVKPHHTVATQIRERQRGRRGETASGVSARVEKASAGRLATDRRVKEPRVTSRMVRAEDADKSQPQFQEVKPKTRAEKPQAGPAIHRPTPPDRGKRKTDVAGTAATGGAPKDAESGKPQRPRRPEKAIAKPAKGPTPLGTAKEAESGKPHRPQRPETAMPAAPGKAPVPPVAAQEGESSRPERPERSEKAVKAPPARGADRPPKPEGAARPATPESLGTPAKLGQGGNGQGRARPGTLDRPAGQAAKPHVKAAERPQQPQRLGQPAERAPERQSQAPQQQGEERQGKGKQRGE